MNKVAIMITSCDAYKECWAPMVYSMDKFWPDCEYPRFIVTNYIEDKEIRNVNFIKVGDDKKSWCTLAKKGLESIDCDYVIFFQDDYWLEKKVNNKAIKEHIRYMDENKIDYLKLNTDINRDTNRIGRTDYCENPLDKRYAFNTAIAIWRKKVILQTLIDGWSGWYFERNIIPYMKEHNINFKSQCLLSSIVPYKGILDIKGGAIVRGVWTDSAEKFLKENGMLDVLAKRKILGKISQWLYNNSPGPNSIFRFPFWGLLKCLKAFNLNW